jgi:hypothetical protein
VLQLDRRATELLWQRSEHLSCCRRQLDEKRLAAFVDRVERASDDCFRVIVRGVVEPVPMSRRHAARLRQLSA